MTISAEHLSKMAKVKLPRRLHGMVIFSIQLRITYQDLALKLTPREKIGLEVIHILTKTDVSR